MAFASRFAILFHLFILAHAAVLRSRSSLLAAESKNKTNNTEGSDFASCPFVGKKDGDHEFVAAIVKLLRETGRPFYLGGGNALSMIRFGTISPQPQADSSRTVSFDDDLDFMVYSKDDSDRAAFNYDLQTRCNAAGIFGGCTNWFRIWSGKNKLKVQYADFYDLRDGGPNQMMVVNYGEMGRSWAIARDSLYPPKNAKFYDVSVPVPNQAIRFFSAVLPWKIGDSYPEYGAGCNGMCYPALVAKKLIGNTGLSESVVKTGLKQCALWLHTQGFASFHQCFQTVFFCSKGGLQSCMACARK